ncbi:MAG TPA: metallophosphoesterase family protein [Pseudonocardiaceae bacterium]|nr:metallophosphoesterase family protein [Pseudonocardiaceae bacterium]
MAELDRRSVLRAAGLGAAFSMAGAASVALPGTAAAAPGLLAQPGSAGAPPVLGLHTTYGQDPASQAVISWISPVSVAKPRVRVGTAHGGFGFVLPAETTHYTDQASGTEVLVHHAPVGGLPPDAEFVYQVLQGDQTSATGTFRTAPRGRAPFRFTSFGDQSTPVAGDALGSVHAGDIVDQVEQANPLFHLMNGDLCYANLATDRLKQWRDWFANNERSMRNRPWMPAAGNHENELGNGPIGYVGYQTYFRLPHDGSADPEFAGLWYAYTVGSVRFVHLANDDVAYQDGGSSYVRGYSGDAQRRWLERELATARARPGVDWIVVCMHQVVISSADFNGADLGLRQQWAPLFDRYGVDLVLCGHEHHYERSHPVRGVVSGSATLTPNPVSTGTEIVDTSRGTVHMILGGGGTSAPSNQDLYYPAQCKVITGVGPADPTTGKRPAIYEMEAAPWAAVRDHEHAYGFAAFDVDPGAPGGHTRITVTYFDSLGSGAGELVPFEKFVLERPRTDRLSAH